MARIFDETFEATGYDESWTEHVSGSGTVDPDVATSGVTGAPNDWGSRCFLASLGAASFSEAYIDAATTFPDLTFSRVEIISDDPGVLGFSGLNASAVSLYGVGVIGGNLTVRVNDSGIGLVTKHSRTFDADTRYRVEFMWDAVNDLWEARVDGTSVGSGPLTNSSAGTPLGILRAGNVLGNAGRMWFDNIAVDDADWVGAEGALPAEDVLVTAIDDDEATVEWTDPNGASVAPRMYRRPTPSTDWEFVTELAASAESYIHTGLDPGVEYDFGVGYRKN